MFGHVLRMNKNTPSKKVNKALFPSTTGCEIKKTKASYNCVNVESRERTKELNKRSAIPTLKSEPAEHQNKGSEPKALAKDR